eukprot:CAMPEP_0182906644 /NCGR_PEP_ID=MMETSP0034_2-20130328/33895_1 /TAXON_ID=156128 /ORGANISM="Nephroselmis pyriformis, Strain CCMP717" /LENGTH=70 /DNA_ID=CAMNT_0025042367 /DNA_START=29 /DNA_END=237 /DNA_ORIENTATION=+
MRGAAGPAAAQAPAEHASVETLVRARPSRTIHNPSFEATALGESSPLASLTASNSATPSKRPCGLKLTNA